MLDMALERIDAEARRYGLRADLTRTVQVSASLADPLTSRTPTVGQVRAWLDRLPSRRRGRQELPIVEGLGVIRDANWLAASEAVLGELAEPAPQILAWPVTRPALVGWARRFWLSSEIARPARQIDADLRWEAGEASVGHVLTLHELGLTPPSRLRTLAASLQRLVWPALAFEASWKGRSAKLSRPDAVGELWDAISEQQEVLARDFSAMFQSSPSVQLDLAWTRVSLLMAGCEGDGRVFLPVERPWRVRCSCPERADAPCAAKLTATRMLLTLLGSGPLPSWAEEAVRQAGLAADERWLDAFTRALAPPEMEEGAWLGWQIARTGPIYVTPARVRPGRTGEAFVVRPFEADTGSELDAWASEPRDRDLLRQWKMLQPLRSNRHAQWSDDLLVTELAGHPRCYLKGAGGAVPCAVERHEGRLIFDDEGGGRVGVQVRFGEERRMTPAECGALFPEPGVRIEIDVSARRVVCLIASSTLLRAASIASRTPLDGLGARVGERLRHTQVHALGAGTVELGGGLRGAEVSTSADPVVVLELGERLRVQLRVQPLEGAATVEPGAGEPLVYGTHDGAPIHGVRDLAAELELAGQAVDVLGLSASRGHAWWLPVDDTAFDLVERLKELEAEGLDVRWSSAPIRVQRGGTLKVQLRPTRRHAWFRVGGELEVEDGVVPLAELLTAAREGRHWVRLDADRWVRLEERLRHSLTSWSEVLDDDDRVSPLAASALVEAADASIVIDAPAKWLRLRERCAEAQTLAPKIPESLTATLRPYQVEGFDWLARLAHWAPGAILADDMGLGKTVQALALLLRRRQEGPALVVAPTSLGFNWLRETARFAPSLEPRPIRRGAEVEDTLGAAGRGTLVVVSYDLVARHAERFGAVEWGTIVFDEAQALKNPETQRARAAFQLQAGFRLGLTGTPIENHTGELWSLFRAIVPGLLGSQDVFRRVFQLPIERSADPKVRRRLAQRVRPFILRRLKGEVARDLPERTDIRLDVALSASERRLYDELRRSVLAELQSDDADPTARFRLLAAITRLRQLACHPKLYQPESQAASSKLGLLREMIAELREEGHRALIFSQFTQLLDLVREALEADGVRCAWLDGSLTATARHRAVDAFQAGGHDVFLLSIKAGGTGLNLTAASFVFLLDPWWNPAVEAQATDRAHRIGQTEPVTVYRLVAVGTIEEAIYALHEEKRALMDAVLDGTGRATSLAPDELRALIAADGSSVDGDEDELQIDRADEARSRIGALLGTSATPHDLPTSQPIAERSEVVEPARIEVEPADGPAIELAVEPDVQVEVEASVEPEVLPAPAPEPAPSVELAPEAPAPDLPEASTSPDLVESSPVVEGSPAVEISPAVESPSNAAAIQRLVEARLEEAHLRGELSSGTVGIYRSKLGRLITWMLANEVPMQPDAVVAAVPRFKRAVSTGRFEAPPSDAPIAGSVARWMAKALEQEGVAAVE